MSKSTAGRPQDLPPEVLDSIARGNNPLAALRNWKHYTIGELARIAGVSEENLEAAERGEGLILQERVALATSLGVNPDLFTAREKPSDAAGKSRPVEANEDGRKEIDQSPVAESELGRKPIDRS